MDRRAWQATVHGVAKLNTTEQQTLSLFQWHQDMQLNQKQKIN